MSVPIPGLPALPPTAATPVLTLALSEASSALLWQASQSPPAWGVFDDQGNLLIEPDSILDFTNRAQRDISKFPVQRGSFADYNKVAQPFEVVLRLSKGGTETDRATFLQALDNLLDSIDLCTVTTPERVYLNLNAGHYEVVRRGVRGAFFLTEVDVYFEEILQTNAQYTTTDVQLPDAQDEAAQPVSNVGNVQPQVPSSALAQDGQAALGAQAQFPEGY